MYHCRPPAIPPPGTSGSALVTTGGVVTRAALTRTDAPRSAEAVLIRPARVTVPGAARTVVATRPAV
ncbi:hypothetical protein [Actinoplanes sp. NPDC049802]|uniref:hypothetical protein n=1 Tax=Actinoplanes sp. NPDC049802 TaxID=3154742 RepID=UPI0033F6B31B